MINGVYMKLKEIFSNLFYIIYLIVVITIFAVIFITKQMKYGDGIFFNFIIFFICVLICAFLGLIITYILINSGILKKYTKSRVLNSLKPSIFEWILLGIFFIISIFSNPIAYAFGQVLGLYILMILINLIILGDSKNG
jgi:uncharacterized membrane protein